MDRYLRRNSRLWIVVLISLSTLAESGLSYNRGPVPNKTQGQHVQPQGSVVKQEPQRPEISASPRPVVVTCHPDFMEVVVQADMFATGLHVDGGHLSLGEGATCGAVQSGEAEFTIRSHLMDCGTRLSSTPEKIIYSNVLVYSPQPSADGLLRLEGASIPVECHYEKKYRVDCFPLQSTWVPFVSRMSGDNRIDFNLLIMTENWQFERGSNAYYLGDPIHVEVSAVIRNHMPLRVFVDHCVATATPDAQAQIRYDFIENYGCLADTYLTNSSSHFLPRVEEHKLGFQMEAFRFYHDPSNQVYITCYVRAVPVSAVSSQDRACSLIHNRWRSADGNDQVCSSCGPSHTAVEPPPTEAPETTMATKALPPLTQQENFDWNRQQQQQQQSTSYFRINPGARQRQHNELVGFTKREAELRAEKSVQLGPIIVLPSRRPDRKSADSKLTLTQENSTT